MDIWFWVVILLAAVLIGVVMIGRRSRASRVDPTELSIDPVLAGQVRERYSAGDKVGAVKLLRTATGLGLADAIRIADKLGATTNPIGKTGPSLTKDVPANGSTLGPDHEAEVRALVAGGNKIAAIDLVHTVTGVGLKEAKRIVDRM